MEAKGLEPSNLLTSTLIAPPAVRFLGMTFVLLEPSRGSVRMPRSRGCAGPLSERTARAVRLPRSSWIARSPAPSTVWMRGRRRANAHPFRVGTLDLPCSPKANWNWSPVVAAVSNAFYGEFGFKGVLRRSAHVTSRAAGEVTRAGTEL